MSSPVVIWIWFCAYLNCVGWTLSALHQLNKTGYGVAFAFGLAAVWIWKKQAGATLLPPIHFLKYSRRFRRAFPLAFLILATLAFLGGALHGPANYDTLAYRTPRVLHWLAAEQWQWIHTDFQRLNTRTAGFEWLTAPQFLFLRTDYLVFLLNVISFLLLPGRVFAVLTRLGVRPRAAWHWMWLFPSGYGYVLQAGSVVNDLFGALMTLAAIEFALRARQKNQVADLWTSGLAVALMTAVKAFNIVLLLPWCLAALPAFKNLLRRPLASTAVILLAVSASMIPTSALNWHVCRDWTGAKIEQVTIGGGHELLRLAVNVPNLLLGNFAPPVFPFVKNWEDFVQSALPATVTATLRANFEGGPARFQIADLQVEESAGLGCGLSLLLLWLLIKKIRAGEKLFPKFFCVETLVPLGAWAGLGVFMVRVGVSGTARYFLPFYLLLLVPVMTGPVAAGIFQRRAWRRAAFAIFSVAGLLLVFSPPRPLWPANTILAACDAEHSANHLLQRAWKVYSVYGVRADSFAPVLAVLPPDANPLGLVTFDEPEAAVWRPFGARRILHITKDDSAEFVRAQGIHYALVSEQFLANHAHTDAAAWLAHFRAEQVQEFKLRLHAGHEPEGWLLVKFP